MTSAKLTGTWQGTYEYGGGYESEQPRAVPFRISATEGALGRIGGYVRDDASQGGMPERGRISGRRQSDKIEFVKTMPNQYFSNDDGELIPVREALLAETGLDLPELPPARIQYTGKLSDSGDEIEGEWEVLPTRIQADDAILEFGQGSGTWSMRRVSDLVDEV